jgi:hypothetical protein
MAEKRHSARNEQLSFAILVVLGLGLGPGPRQAGSEYKNAFSMLRSGTVVVVLISARLSCSILYW